MRSRTAWVGGPEHRERRDRCGTGPQCWRFCPRRKAGLFAAGLAVWLLGVAGAPGQRPERPTVRILVLGLFHPQHLVLTAEVPLAITLDGRVRVVEAHHAVELRALPAGPRADGLRMDGLRVDELAGTQLTVPAATFTLAVPGKLTRTYRGGLTVVSRGGALRPVLIVDTELAVASIVAAESPAGAPLEALKAQAIVSRSYLLANPHAHAEADACDTTHCQFLRSPPAPESAAARATEATRHQVLVWRPSEGAEQVLVAARYSRSCGGHTRTPAAMPRGSYPFYRVACDFCLAHPERWTRTAAAAPETEAGRVAWNRTHGWSAIPSNSYQRLGEQMEGSGIGHGVGLCQLGADDLAKRGATFSVILDHYFPNTTISVLP